MAKPDLDALLDRPFVFRERPTSTSGDHRPVWRLPLLLLLVRACRGQKATHEQLHVLNWAVRSTDRSRILSDFLCGKVRPEEAVVRFEPALDRAVALARGFELLTWQQRYWEIGERGEQVLTAVDQEDEVLKAEKGALASLPQPLSQAAVQRLLRREGS